MHWLDWEEPDLERPRPFDRFCAALAARRRALIAAIAVAPLAVGLFLTFTPQEYRAEAQVFVGNPVTPPAEEPSDARDSPGGAARLIGSRDLGRRAIKQLGVDARAEFDLSGRLDPVARALILLGLTRDPGRLSPDERILKAFEERLSVSASNEEGLVKIGFRSRDRAFAANAANRVANLYLEIRADAAPAGTDARIVSAAAPPRRPAPPGEGLLLAIGAGAFIIAALGFDALGRTPPRPAREEPMAPPLTVGESPVFVRLKNVPKPVAEARQNAAANRAEADNAQALDDIAMRILSARRTASGLRIVGAKLSPGQAGPDVMLPLARVLGGEGRAILIGLDGAAPNAATLAAGDGPDLGDLLSGGASFTEVIRRDPGSRLHFVPAALNQPIDAAELAGIVDALARTYDFIFLMAPPLEASDVARTLAASADFIVLRAPAQPRDAAIAKAEADLRECGARDVLVIGAPTPLRQRLGQDAA